MSAKLENKSSLKKKNCLQQNVTIKKVNVLEKGQIWNKFICLFAYSYTQFACHGDCLIPIGKLLHFSWGLYAN